jgi:DNA primase catalytic core
MSIAERLPVSERINIMVNETGLRLVRQIDGVRSKCLCPFHSEKTPSFHINEKNGLWNCFGCGKGGDFLTFISQCSGIDSKTQFPQLLKYIDDRHGTSLYQEDSSSPEEIRDQYICNDYASNYYHETLLKILRDPDPHPLKNHIAKRNLKLETLKKFRIGYGGDSWTHLLQHLNGITLGSKKLNPEQLEAFHLIFKTDGSAQWIDRFAKRIIFPISQGSRIFSFAGRAIEEFGWKYVNGKESSIFQKSSCLFGFDEALPAIRETGYVILVEGYFDVLATYQLGFQNTVALMGTNLSVGQLDQIRNVTNKILLFLDSDVSGRKAAIERILPVLMTEDIECKVLDPSIHFQFKEKIDAGNLLEEHEQDAANIIRSNQCSADNFALRYCLKEGPKNRPALQNFCIYTFSKIFRNYPNPAKQHTICEKLSNAIGIDQSIIVKYFVDDWKFENLSDEFRYMQTKEQQEKRNAAACSTD